MSEMALFYEEQYPHASYDDIFRHLLRRYGNENTVSGLASSYELESPTATFDQILNMINTRRGP